MKITKRDLYTILTGLFVACLLVSNVIAVKTFTIGQFLLPCAVILFPVTYITNDVLAEIYGFKKTRNIVWLGFTLNLMAVIAYTISIKLQGPDFNTELSQAFAMTLGTTGRMLLASLSAYIIGSLVNAKVMEKMKKKLENQLMLRCITSTIFGEGLDAIIFISIAFLGTMPIKQLAIMVVCQAMFKTIYEVVCYPLTKLVITKVKKLED